MAERTQSWGRLRGAAVALLVAQVLHGLAPAKRGGEESAVGLVLGLLGVLATVAVVVAVAQRRPQAPGLATLAGTSIAVGFVAYHASPFQSSVTNPYWGDGSASGAQWLTVVLVLATAALCVREARALVTGRRATVVTV